MSDETVRVPAALPTEPGSVIEADADFGEYGFSGETLFRVPTGWRDMNGSFFDGSNLTLVHVLFDAAERPDEGEDECAECGNTGGYHSLRCSHRAVITRVAAPLVACPKCGHDVDSPDGCSECPAPVGEPLPLGHEYVGNLCSGFGGTTECEWFDIDTRQRCGQSPGAHRPNPFTPAPLSSPRRTRGGYESSSRDVSELAPPPNGPAPGVRRTRDEGITLTDEERERLAKLLPYSTRRRSTGTYDKVTNKVLAAVESIIAARLAGEDDR